MDVSEEHIPARVSMSTSYSLGSHEAGPLLIQGRPTNAC